MNIVQDLLLRSSSQSGMPCIVPATAVTISAKSKAWGKIKGKFNSPGNLHAYDGQGNHTGLKENGEIEFGIPETVYLEGYTEGRHFQMIEYATDPEHETVYFTISGNDSGPFTFDVLTEKPDGSIEELSFDGDITPSMQLQFQPSKGNALNVDAENDGVFETFMYGITAKYPAEQQPEIPSTQANVVENPAGVKVKYPIEESPQKQPAIKSSLASLAMPALILIALLAIAGYWFVQNQKKQGQKTGKKK